MSKVYIITDKDIERLEQSLKLIQFEQFYGVDQCIIQDIYRSYNYKIQEWLSDIKK